MSSTPPRNSDFSLELRKASSKLSTTGSSVRMASASAKSRNSCCSRTARLRALSNSACERAKRSSTESRSAFSFCNSALPDSVALDSSAAGNSCAGSNPCFSKSRSITSVFPFIFAITLLGIIQNFVKQARDIGDRCDRMLIVHARRPNYRQRPSDFTADTGWCANQHQIAQGRIGLIETDNNPYCFLSRIQICAQQFDDFLFFLQRLEQFLQALAVLLAGHQVGRAFHKDKLGTVIRHQRTLLVELLDGLHQLVVFAALLLNAACQLQAQRFHGPAAEILIDITGRRVQVGLRHFHPQQPVAYDTRLGHHYGQNFLVGQP